MFRRYIAIFLLFALFAASFQRYMVYAGFELNHSYIAKNLCVNHNKPWLHCDGKCYFMRKLKQAQDNEKKQAAQDNLNRLEVSFFQQPITFQFLNFTVEEPTVQHYDAYSRSYSHQHSTSVFQPPAAV